MNFIDSITDERKLVATLAIMTSLFVVGITGANYYHSTAQASYEGFPIEEFIVEDNTDFIRYLDAPEKDFSNPGKVADTLNDNILTGLDLDSSQIDTANSVIKKTLIGNYTGIRLEFLKPGLRFSQSNLFISDAFELNLKAEQTITNLQIQGLQPRAYVEFNGSFVPENDYKTARIVINSLKIDFKINDQPVTPEVKSQILKILGLDDKDFLQNVDPILFRVNLKANKNILYLTNLKNSNILFNFSGTQLQ